MPKTELKCFGSSLSCISLQIFFWGGSRLAAALVYCLCGWVGGGAVDVLCGWHLGQHKRGLLMDVQAAVGPTDGDTDDAVGWTGDSPISI